MVFEQDGSFIRAWGEGRFRRPHGLTLARDELLGAVLYCVDDDGHWIGKFTLDGELLMALGKRGAADEQGNYLAQWIHRDRISTG